MDHIDLLKLLREKRLRKGLTQAGLAKQLGVTQGYVGRIELGNAIPTNVLLLEKWARAIGEDSKELTAQFKELRIQEKVSNVAGRLSKHLQASTIVREGSTNSTLYFLFDIEDRYLEKKLKQIEELTLQNVDTVGININPDEIANRVLLNVRPLSKNEQDTLDNWSFSNELKKNKYLLKSASKHSDKRSQALYEITYITVMLLVSKSPLRESQLRVVANHFLRRCNLDSTLLMRLQRFIMMFILEAAPITV